MVDIEVCTTVGSPSDLVSSLLLDGYPEYPPCSLSPFFCTRLQSFTKLALNVFQSLYLYLCSKYVPVIGLPFNCLALMLSGSLLAPNE